MAKHKTGLQKKVSSIFNGVPIQKNDGDRETPGILAPVRPDYKEHPKPDKGLVPPVCPKSFAPSHLTPQLPEPQQPEQALPKEAPAEQPKADTATTTTAMQIWWQQARQQIKDKLFAPKPGVSATKQKMMVILVPVLFIILIFVFTQVLSTPLYKTTEPGSLGPTSAVAASNKIDWLIPEPYPTTLRDPMQFGSLTTVHGETGMLTVRGIVYSQDKPSAVVGTQIVYEGDEVFGATVVKINKDSVELEMNGKKWTQKVQH